MKFLLIGNGFIVPRHKEAIENIKGEITEVFGLEKGENYCHFLPREQFLLYSLKCSSPVESTRKGERLTKLRFFLSRTKCPTKYKAEDTLS